MRDQRNLAWKLNWYRQSELDGALLLGKLVRRAREPYLVHQLIKHCADEARHAWLWDRTIVSLGLPTVRIRRSYQSFYLDETSAPRGLTETLALTHVFEQRVHQQFAEDLREPTLPDEARRTFVTLLRDEEGHLEWIARWLDDVPASAAMLLRYFEVDQRVYDRLAEHRDRIWEIAGIGEWDVPKEENGCTEKLDTAESEHPAEADA